METIFSLALNVLNIYTDFRFFRLFASRKKVCMVLQVVTYVSIWSINSVMYLYIDNIFLTTGTLFLLLLTAMVLLYEGSIVRKLAAVTSAIALGTLFEEIVWIILIWAGDESPNGAAGSLLSSLLYIVFILVIERFFYVNKEDYISKSSYFNIFLLLIGSVVMVGALDGFNGQYELIFVCLSAICLINVSTFYLYDKVNDVYRESLDSKVMEERIAMHENQIALMKQSQENIRSLWHDMKNHLLLLDTYISQAENEKASQYIKNIQDYMHVPGQHVNSGNYEVDAILNYRLEKAKKMGCKTEIKLKVPDCSFMSDFDLNMILGNLLDNALEALEHTKNKYLSVDLKYEKGILVIHICNSYDGTLEQSGKEFVTRKQDRENHGLGLRNVEQIVKKYNGEQVIQTEGSIFKTSVILYVT